MATGLLLSFRSELHMPLDAWWLRTSCSNPTSIRTSSRSLCNLQHSLSVLTLRLLREVVGTQDGSLGKRHLAEVHELVLPHGLLRVEHWVHFACFLKLLMVAIAPLVEGLQLKWILKATSHWHRSHRAKALLLWLLSSFARWRILSWEVILAVLGLRCSFLALGFSLAFLRRDLGIFGGSFYFRSWLLLTGLAFTGGLLSRIRVFCVIVLLIAATNQRADLTLVTVDRSRIDTQVLGSLGIWIDVGVRVLHLLLSALSD